MELKLDTQHIFELGNSINQQLANAGISELAELSIFVNKNQLRKIDEDLFYRREHDKNEEFTPSEKEIIVKFDKVILTIKSKDGLNDDE